mmetsp:Transcript_3568/g.7824  ORF Transcript_3568/g.7824 Transcript_3568/m.7824 type:complete len:307 (+) Transcript_3568:109-1029(+)
MLLGISLPLGPRLLRHYGGANRRQMRGPSATVLVALLASLIASIDVLQSSPGASLASVRSTLSVARNASTKEEIIPLNRTEPVELNLTLSGFLRDQPRAFVHSPPAGSDGVVHRLITVWRKEDLAFLGLIDVRRRLRVSYWRNLPDQSVRSQDVQVKVLTDAVHPLPERGRRRPWLVFFEANVSLPRSTMLHRCIEDWRNASLSVYSHEGASSAKIPVLEIRCPVRPKGFLAELGVLPPSASAVRRQGSSKWVTYAALVAWRLATQASKMLLLVLISPQRCKWFALLMFIVVYLLLHVVSFLQEQR